MYHKYHRINPNRGGSYIDSPDWIKNKKAAINPINKKDRKEINLKKLKQNDVTIAHNVLYAKKEKRYPAYVSLL